MLYLCIPARDEESTIGPLLWKVRKVMAEFGRDYHVLVLDDGSVDATPETLDRYRRFLPLTVLREEASVGYARAMERLLREAVQLSRYPKRDAVLTLQADFSESPDLLIPLVKTLEGGADVVVGRQEEAMGDPIPGPRIWTRRGARFVMGSALKGAPVSDPFCGLRAYRIISLRKVFRELGDRPLTTGEGWGANLEILSAVAPFARRIEETPMQVRYRDLPRESRFRGWDVFRTLLKLRGRVRWVRPLEEPVAS
jgi:glycosyltransferase involved in cell wall biosynthesis